MGKVVDIDREELIRLDEMLKAKIKFELEQAVQSIERNDPQKDYLVGVIIDVADYGHNEPASKWWFHLIDERTLEIAVKNHV